MKGRRGSRCCRWCRSGSGGWGWHGRVVRHELDVVYVVGRAYPRSFLELSRLSPLSLRKSEDGFVDDLFAPVAAIGVPLIAARFPRAFLDVNREPYELDPELFAGPLPEYANTQSVRVAGGLGTIARIVADGEEIYRGKLPLEAGLARVEHLYNPFHAALRDLLDVTRRRFGYAILIDCHSMPHEAIEAHTRPGQPRPEVVLGDRFGATAGRDVMDRVEAAFSGAGLRVGRNAPFAGAYVAQAYGRPSRGVHVVQVEIDRALYMDEVRVEPLAGFEGFRELIGGVVAELVQPPGVALAAE